MECLQQQRAAPRTMTLDKRGDSGHCRKPESGGEIPKGSFHHALDGGWLWHLLEPGLPDPAQPLACPCLPDGSHCPWHPCCFYLLIHPHLQRPRTEGRAEARQWGGVRAVLPAPPMTTLTFSLPVSILTLS